MSNKLKILLIEDHEADARLVEEALIDCDLQVDLTCLNNGEEGIRYLQKQEPFKKSPTPDLIILDLNMPKKDGHQFLDEAKELLQKQEIPVVLLTVSDSQEDVERALQSRMNFYLSKPVRASQLQGVLSVMSNLWFAHKAS